MHWRAVSIGTADAKLESAQVAYGDRHYIVAGSRGGKKVVLNSSDGETWDEQVLDDPNPWSNGPVKYVHGRFFILSASLWTSLDGQRWSLLDQPYKYSGLSDIAYGNGRYLGVGSGTLLSDDGIAWRSAPIGCALAGACVTTLEGTAVEGASSGVFFAQGKFHVLPDGIPEGGFSSSDGESWQFAPAFIPDAYVGGHFVRLFDVQPRVWLDNDRSAHSIDAIHRSSMLPAGISAPTAMRWSSETNGSPDAFPQDEAMPAELDFSWRDGLDCTNARCLIVTSGNQSQLLLVP
jgi:hypothetical protein